MPEDDDVEFLMEVIVLENEPAEVVENQNIRREHENNREFNEEEAVERGNQPFFQQAMQAFQFQQVARLVNHVQIADQIQHNRQQFYAQPPIHVYHPALLPHEHNYPVEPPLQNFQDWNLFWLWFEQNHERLAGVIAPPPQNPQPAVQNEPLNRVWGNERPQAIQPAIENIDECSVCFENRINTVSLPCRHAQMCTDCMKKVRTQNNACPYCGELIRDYVPFFRG